MQEKIDYDEIVHNQLNNVSIIDYGIIKGNETIVFIKAGQNGSMYGYKNKYLNIAKSINNKYGYTVICSSNPFDGSNPLDNAMEIINDYCIKQNIKEYKIYYMGHSNGALIGARYGIKYPQIKRMLLINTPLMINWHRIKEGIQEFSGEKITFIYGSLDLSYKYTTLLTPLLNDKIKLEIIEGQDHHFSKNTYDFKELPEDFLLF